MNKNPDILIVGGGIVGLWCAVKAMQQGLSTSLYEQNIIGSGASGGFLGALMPHQPIKWNEKKQFQLRALIELETEIQKIESATGLTCGYRRCGRLIPIRNEEKLRQSLTYQEAAQTNWPDTSETGTRLDWNILDKIPDPNWLNSARAPLACDYDTLSAKVNPRALLGCLKKLASAKADIYENSPVADVQINGDVKLQDGTRIQAGKVIVAAGYESFDLLQPLTRKPLGKGVKGQAVLLQPEHKVSTASPIIYDGGTYIIAHEDGHVAVGSTSENEFQDPTQTDDDAIEGLIAKATRLCPALADASVIERWAGVRPKAIGRDPIVGNVPDSSSRVIVASGGFKISLGIAHKLAEAAIASSHNSTTELPESFHPTHHFSALES